MSEKSNAEVKDDFVKFMLEKSQKEDEKPKPNTADVDPNQIEQILNKIRRDIQEKK